MLRFLAFLVLVVSGLSYGKGPVWVTDFEKGIKMAKAQGKGVLVYFYGESCPYCSQMENFVLGDPEVESFVRERFVIVSLSLRESRDLAKRLGAVGVPYFVFYDPQGGNVILRVFGSRDRDDFLNLLIMACEKSHLRRC